MNHRDYVHDFGGELSSFYSCLLWRRTVGIMFLFFEANHRYCDPIFEVNHRNCANGGYGESRGLCL